jgi:hypothetical protein
MMHGYLALIRMASNWWRSAPGATGLPDRPASFAGQAGSTLEPEPQEVAEFRDFMARYQQGLRIERAAVESLQ